MAESEAGLTVPTFSLHRGDLVTLVVGQDESELVVHESCITRSSEFFKAAMKKEWTEGQTRIIKLPEEPCLETLRHYLNICYGQKLPTEGITTGEGFPMDSYVLLGRIYVLAERVLDKSVKNAAIKELTRLSTLKTAKNHHWIPAQDTIGVIYEGTPTGSPARRLIVDLHVARAPEDCHSDTYHPAFLLDLSKSLLAKINAQVSVRDFRHRLQQAEDYLS